MKERIVKREAKIQIALETKTFIFFVPQRRKLFRWGSWFQNVPVICTPGTCIEIYVLTHCLRTKLEECGIMYEVGFETLEEAEDFLAEMRTVRIKDGNKEETVFST